MARIEDTAADAMQAFNDTRTIALFVEALLRGRRQRNKATTGRARLSRRWSRTVGIVPGTGTANAAAGNGTAVAAGTATAAASASAGASSTAPAIAEEEEDGADAEAQAETEAAAESTAPAAVEVPRQRKVAFGGHVAVFDHFRVAAADTTVAFDGAPIGLGALCDAQGVAVATGAAAEYFPPPPIFTAPFDTFVAGIKQFDAEQKALDDVAQADAGSSEEFEPFQFHADGKLDAAKRRQLLLECATPVPEASVQDAEQQNSRNIAERDATKRSETGKRVIAGQSPEEVERWEIEVEQPKWEAEKQARLERQAAREAKIREASMAAPAADA